ncbi:competence type IV pilus major pilin ComGC [Bacillus solitudinis]|uniref:competence type IV pilus major pilin ComGC n=1 Tax=Bacillus solitudinis TaxID=2014074 RepID=UPI000C25174B
MKKILKNQRGFTLIEMLVVLMIISVLLMIAIPSMTKNNDIVQGKGCEATIKLVQTQVHAFEIEKGNIPENLKELVEGNYIDRTSCPDDTELTLDDKGNVITSS